MLSQLRNRFSAPASMRWVSFFFLVSAILVPWRGLDYGCVSAYDLGIFSQIFLGVWRGEWDPFVPLREIYASQDHWDPIVQIFAFVLEPFRAVLSAPRILLLLEASLILGCAWYAWAGFRRRGFSETTARLAFFLILFTPVTWVAIRFPVHPTTWALFAQLALLFWAWDGLGGQEDRFWWMRGLFAVFLLGCCGEQFAVAAAFFLFVLLFFLRGRRRAEAGVVFVFALVFMWWAMKGRELLHGYLYYHAHRLRLDPLRVWELYRFDKTFFHRLFEMGLAMGPVLFWIFRQSREDRDHRLLPFTIAGLALFAPLLAGRLLSGSWGAHYGIVWVGFAMVAFFWGLRLEMTVRRYRITVLLMVLSSISGWGLVFHFARMPAPGCDAIHGEVPPEEWEIRRNEVKEIAGLIKPGAKVLANVHLAAALIDRRDDVDVHALGVYHLAEREKPVEWVLFTKGNFGNAWPLDDGQVESLRRTLETGGSVRSGQTVLSFEGAWRPEVFDAWSSPQVLKQ